MVVDAESKVAIRRIEVGDQTGTAIVVKAGLNAGDTVIVGGHQKVRPGTHVTAKASDDLTKAPSTQSGN